MRAGRPFLPTVLALLALACAGCGSKDTDGAGADGPWTKLDDPIAAADAFIAAKKIRKDWPDWRVRLPKPPVFRFPADKKVYWTLETNQGRMVARLYQDVAPIHVSSFLYLTRLQFFDGLNFHRVIRGFMAQGGDPVGNGSGWPGYSLPFEIRPGLRHDRAGILSTANSGRPDSDGSQFFIMFAPRPQLDGGYSIFGEVVEGLETVQRMEALGAAGDPGRPRERIVITKATVELR